MLLIIYFCVLKIKQLKNNFKKERVFFQFSKTLFLLKHFKTF